MHQQHYLRLCPRCRALDEENNIWVHRFDDLDIFLKKALHRKVQSHTQYFFFFFFFFYLFIFFFFCIIYPVKLGYGDLHIIKLCTAGKNFNRRHFDFFFFFFFFLEFS